MSAVIDLPDLEMPAPLVFTDNAAKKVKGLIEEEVNEDDTQVQKDSVTLLIDPMSLQYLMGAEIDYQDNLQGSQFVIRNPQATSTCGCGSSFSA